MSTKAKSVLSRGEREVYNAVIEDLKRQYLADDRPWVVGFSGGKDSTCTLQMVYRMLLSMTPEERVKPVHVLSSDTLVEAPVVGIRQKKICRMISAAAEFDDIPLSVEMLRPDITDTFWVNLIGRGYPSPNKWFRWCTDRLKIKPMNKYILENIKRNGEVLIILGARKSESVSRSQTMTKHEIGNTKLRRHGNINGAFVYTPIQDLTEEQVWGYLDNDPSPWGDDNAELKSMYQKKDDEEISFIIDDVSPPSGHSRFGCWVCTVVDKDKAILSLIEDGHTEYQLLADFRDKLKRIRDDPSCRDSFRKNQRVDKFLSQFAGTEVVKEIHRGHEVSGPFLMEVRHELLRELLQIQDELRKTVPEAELISPEEVSAIRTLWLYEGDTANAFEDSTSEGNNIDDLVTRLLRIEDDMSDLSKRVGIYKKLEQVVMEYTMAAMIDEKSIDMETGRLSGGAENDD